MLENKLIKKCKAGDGEAYRQLINPYRSKLFGYLWRFSDSQFVAEEMFQETLIRSWKGLMKYNDQKKFSSWLFTIAHNVAIDSLRSRANKNSITNIEDAKDSFDTITPEDQLIRKEALSQIASYVDKLPEKQKIVFLLRQNGELSFKEIAETTKESINTVLSHMRYAVKKIKKQLEDENEPRKQSVI